MVFEGITLLISSSYNSSESMPSYKRNKLPVKTELYSRVLRKQFNPFAPGDFAEKLILKLVEWFSGHCRAIKRQEKVKKSGGEKVKVKSAVSLLSQKLLLSVRARTLQANILIWIRRL